MTDIAIEPVLLSELIGSDRAAEVAAAGGKDINDIFMTEPTMLDYRIIMAPLDDTSPKARADRDSYALTACLRTKSGLAALTTEQARDLRASTSEAAMALVMGMVIAIHQHSAEAVEKGLGKMGLKLPQLQEKPQPTKNSS